MFPKQGYLRLNDLRKTFDETQKPSIFLRLRFFEKIALRSHPISDLAASSWPYHKSRAESPPAFRWVGRILRYTPKRLGKISSKCSHCGCSCFSSPNLKKAIVFSQCHLYNGVKCLPEVCFLASSQ